MQYIPLSFFAGLLTILSPCVLPLLPVILGGSAGNAKDKLRPIVIIASLSISIVLFTLLLQLSAQYFIIPTLYRDYFSGSVILLFGVFQLFPEIWEWISLRLRISQSSNTLLQKGNERGGLLGAVIMGIALGPIFFGCSPTYFLIVGTLLPESLFVGTINLVFYALGFAAILAPIAYLGQRFVQFTRWAADPTGWFKRTLGIVFIILGLLIIFGYIKLAEVNLAQWDKLQQLQNIEMEIQDFIDR